MYDGYGLNYSFFLAHKFEISISHVFTYYQVYSLFLFKIRNEALWHRYRYHRR